MNHNFFDHINISINNTFVPNGCAVDLAGEGQRYDEHIAKLGGIDLQLLGIGLDGHIGFNEPDKYFVKSTHVVDLHESTIKANSRFLPMKTMFRKRQLQWVWYPLCRQKENFAYSQRQGKARYT